MNDVISLSNDLNKIVFHLDTALAENKENDVFKAGCVHLFEFGFEMSWKILQQKLFDEGLDCYSPKSCIKFTFKTEMIKDEKVWLNMLQDRNLMTHTYDTAEALEVYKNLSPYLKEFKYLLP